MCAEGEVLLVDRATGKAAEPILVDGVTGETITEAEHRFDGRAGGAGEHAEAL